MEKDFRELKEEFMAGKIQAYPDFDSNEPFILTMDWYPLNIAGILSQKQVGVECFIRCWSRKCNRYEKHYPFFERRTVSFSEDHREMETYPEVPVGLGAFLVEQSFFPENERNDQERSHRSEKKRMLRTCS